MLHLPKRASHNIELRMILNPSASKAWVQEYNSPQVSVALKWMDLANPAILGSGWSVAPVFSAPIAAGNRWRLFGELSAGLGYVTKPFDPKTNYKNIAVGSHLNAFVFLGSRFNYWITDRVALCLSANFNHFSNAAYRLPNLGVNYPQVNAGIGYTPIPASPRTDTAYQRLVRGAFELFLAIGLKESPAIRHSTLPAYSLKLARRFFISHKSSISVGIDAYQNTGLAQYVEGKRSFIENIQSGPSVSYTLHIDRFEASIAQGVYVIDRDGSEGIFFHWVNTRYFIGKSTAVSLGLKTHFFKAEHFELGVTYRI
ncbi:MAG: hypothetical protein Kow0075_07930 [Salibacteraceae bacterium]